MHELIIVGVDGSETAAHAARTAARLAAASGARLHVVTAFEKHESSTVSTGSDASPITTADEAQALAHRTANELQDITPLVTGGSALGKPTQVLVEEAERRDATLIVVGNKNMQGISRVLGSVANWVAHHAPCDVYIVKTV